jgi:hypothetical protein
MVAPRILTRANGYKSVAPFRIGNRLTASGEIGVERCLVLIDFMEIAARRIRLPNLNQSVGQRTAVLVQNPPANNDPFTQRLAFVLAGEIVRGRGNQL